MNNEATSMQNLEICTRPGSHVYASDISGADTDGQLISMWLSGLSQATKRAYQHDIGKLMTFKCKTIRETTAKDLIEFSESFSHLATATQHRRLSAVKSMFTYGMRLGYLKLNPAAALRLPKVADNRAKKFLSAENVQKIIRSTENGRDRLIVRTLYGLGLRESELIRMQADDIHTTKDGHVLTVHGKGEKIRYIALPPKLAADLTAKADSGTIFRSVRGNPLSASDIYRIVRQAGRRAGLRCAPHMLRHSHASHCLDAGAPIHVVKESLGHASLATTSIYSHVKPNDSSALYLECE